MLRYHGLYMSMLTPYITSGNEAVINAGSGKLAQYAPTPGNPSVVPKYSLKALQKELEVGC